jgi:hypothetical protein
MLIERDHVNPDIKQVLEEARALRAKYLRDLFFRKRNSNASGSATSFIILYFFHRPRRVLRSLARATSQSR